ncbi:MAG: hypothetical protein NZM43_10260 [Saprospiraceae bacterium]|nr:hypothetical protein [Saprospiraceae bacterium]MDW8484696.1 hypothetical protein [Saprospiraceae bacterium]
MQERVLFIMFIVLTKVIAASSLHAQDHSLLKASLGATGETPKKTPLLYFSLLDTREAKRSSAAVLPTIVSSDLPFFCRIEHQLNRRAMLKVKFRLGDVSYVDWLEGKRHWYE